MCLANWQRAEISRVKRVKLRRRTWRHVFDDRDHEDPV